jgi:hypothetical protein
MAYGNGILGTGGSRVTRITVKKNAKIEAGSTNRSTISSRTPVDTHRENVEERVRKFGKAFEALRQSYVTRLRGHFDSLYEHGSLADLVALCMAFEEWEEHSRGHRKLSSVVVQT